MDSARKAIAQMLAGQVPEPITLEVPDKPGFGDLAYPCFTLAKEQKGNPMKIAQELAAKLKPTAWVQKIEAKGPYVNFFLNPAQFAQSVIVDVAKRHNFGSHLSSDPKRIVIEYSCPNTNKPLHLGHLRNIFLGKSVANLLTSQAHTVIHVNLNNDRGVHICKSMLAYQKWGKGAKPDKKSDHYVGDWYVRFAKEAVTNPALEQEAQVLLQQWEAGDPEVRKLWQQMNQWALEGFDQTYKLLGVRFDKVYNESAFYDRAKLLVEEGIENGVFERKEDGSIIAPLEEYKLPNKVVLRADGTSIYITQDMYLAKLKQQDFTFDISINVVGAEQNLHFQQLYKILQLLGFAWAKDCYHLSYGMVNLPSGRMKSREGTVVDADDLIAEVEQLCAVEITKRHPELDAPAVQKRAKQIGLGALRFFLLKFDPAKDMVFNPEESIALEGETGPYVQYAAARIASVLRKHGKALPEEFNAALLATPEELTILKQIAQFPELVSTAARQYKPSLVAHYLVELSQAFNTFYHLHQVLQVESELRDARLHLCAAVRRVLVNGLGLLDIEVPEGM